MKADFYDGGSQTLFDPYTNDLIEHGLLDYIIDKLGYHEHHFYHFSIAYILILFLIIFTINRVFFLLPPLLLGFLCWKGLPQSSMLPMIMFAIWIMSRLRTLYGSDKEQEKHLVPQFLPQTKTGISARTYQIFFIVALMVMTAVINEEYATRMRPIVPILLVLMGSTLVPGVGGHSTMGMISLLFLFLTGFMIFPQVSAAIEMALTEMIKPRGTLPPIAEIRETSSSVLGNRNFEFLVSLTSAAGLFRIMIGFIVQWWLFFDDFLGASFTLNELMKIKNRSDVNNRKVAGIYSSHWVSSLILTVVLNFYISAYISLVLFTMAGFITWFAWRYLGSSIWEGRGQVASSTDNRQGIMIVFGEGPSDFRKLLVWVCATICICQLAIFESYSWSVILILAFLLTCRSTQAQCFVLGIASVNLTLIWYAIKLHNPLNSTLEEAQIPAYSPTVGWNSSEGTRRPTGLPTYSIETPTPTPASIPPAVIMVPDEPP